MTPKITLTAKATGFTLIEIAIVLFIITLALGSLIPTLGRYAESRANSDTQTTLEQARNAIIGYALTNGYLPCPDNITVAASDYDGLENRQPNGTCYFYEGAFPFATLGVKGNDYWGHRIRYATTSNFSDYTIASGVVAPKLSLATTGELKVCTQTPVASANCPAASSLAENLAAVLVSHGANGRGAPGYGISAQSDYEKANDHPLPPLGLIPTFLVREHITPLDFEGMGTSYNNEYDDIVLGISAPVLLQNLVQAGRVPKPTTP